jgi:tetratricopeptide (TPR) repeat protein
VEVPRGSSRERSIELNPNYVHAHHWYSHCLVSMGRFSESLAESRRALELEPLSLVMNTHLGWHYFYARQFDDAIVQLKTSIEMDPNWAYAHYYLGLSYEQKGMYDEAVAALQRALVILPGAIAVQADLGHVYALAGRPSETREVLERLLQLPRDAYVSAFFLARLYEALGETDRAFEAMQKACEERTDLLHNLGNEPRVDPLRTDPRFGKLMKEVGLDPNCSYPDYSGASLTSD